MPWYAVVDDATGRLVSLTSALPPLAAGLAGVELAQRPADSTMWDATTRTFVPRPAKVVVTLLAKFQADPDITALTAANRTKAVNAFKRTYALANGVDPSEVMVRG